MKSRVVAEWNGWDGDTIVRLDNGSVWRQDQYFYQYKYKYRPTAIIDGNVMLVEGMRKAVRVRRID